MHAVCGVLRRRINKRTDALMAILRDELKENMFFYTEIRNVPQQQFS